MNTETYEILALAARYWFIALAAMIVFKGWRASVKDNRKARELREWPGGAGYVGELVVLEDGIRNRKRSLKGARFPVPQEGLIGSGSTADICIRHSDVKRKHIWFIYEKPGKLRLTLAGRVQAETPVMADGRRILRDGDRLTIGRLKMVMAFEMKDASVVRLKRSKRPPRPRRPVEDEYEDLYEENFWE